MMDKLTVFAFVWIIGLQSSQVFAQKIPETNCTTNDTCTALDAKSICDIGGTYKCTCDTGYGLNATQTQCLFDCGALTINDGTVTTTAENLAGSSASFKCNDNFVLSHNDTSTCKDGNSWDTAPPTCDCKTPNLPGGSVNVTGTKIGAKATYSCLTGFTLRGVTERTCTSGTGWSENAPTCECNLPTPPTDGSLNPSTGTVAINGKVTYQCNTSFEIIETATTRTCTSTGWDSTAPTCGCEKLPDITGGSSGTANSTVTPVGGNTTYSCNTGLTLVGDAQRECQSGTGWVGLITECKCAAINTTIPHGNVDALSGTFSIGHIATYTCNSSFVPVGNATRTCTSTGWDGTPPTCKCPALTVPNGAVTPAGPATTGTVATYACNTNYKLATGQTATRTCETGTGWSVPAPTCYEDCGSLPAPTNGKVTYTDTIVGSVANFICDPKYKRVGESSLTCQTGRTWNHPPPTCEGDCGDLPKPANGNVTYDDTIVNQKAKYTCKEGFLLDGSDERICDGTSVPARWSSTEPTCERGKLKDDCSENTNLCVKISNAKCTADIHVCTCLDGYESDGTGLHCDEIDECAGDTCAPNGICLDGINQFTCTCLPDYTGTYCEKDVDECEKHECPDNAKCVNLVGEYKCECPDGFTGRYCQTDIDDCVGVNLCLNRGICNDSQGGYTCVCPKGYVGQFCETDTNECNPNPCQNGGVCKEGIGEFTCTCEAGFTGNTCEKPTNECIPNPCKHGTCNDSRADYECTCEVGYTGKDCSTDIDECALSPCGHGTCINLLNSYMCKCDDGYEGTTCSNNINDCANNLCANGAVCIDQVGGYICKCSTGFSGTYCDNSCPEPDIPANGLVDTTEGLGVGNTIYYSCMEGYKLVGKANRICETTSTWSGMEPTCLIQCPVLEAISHGNVDMSLGRHEGSIATYSCENNYALIGFPTMTCESSGVWGGMKPDCVFAMFPDTLLAFGSVLILLVLVDLFVVGICVYYRFCRNKMPSQTKPYPDVFFAEGEKAVPPRESAMPPFSRKQTFAKVTPDDAHPPPQRLDEPNIVYRSTMKMSDQVLDAIFSKGGKYRRQEDAERRIPDLDDDVIHDKGYNTGNSNSMEDAHSEDFDKHLDLTQSTGPGKSPKETRKPEEPDEEEEDEEDRFRFRLRGPPPSITDSLFKEKETSLATYDKRRSKSALPSYRIQKK